jgi:hypothetical protein
MIQRQEEQPAARGQVSAIPSVTPGSPCEAPAPSPSNVPRSPRWPAAVAAALFAQVLLPFRPRRAALRAANVSLPVVFTAHVIGMLLGIALCFVACTLVVYTSDALFSPYHWIVERYGSYFGFVLVGVQEAWRAVQRPESWAVITIIFLVLEGSLACNAGLLLPWGAADEPLIESVRRSLRTAWLAAPMVFWGIFGVTAMGCINDAIRSTLFAGSQRHELPFPFREEEFYGLTVALLSVWTLWAVLRAACSIHAPATHVITTKCESCGYELSHTPIESRCPECGEPAADSLGAGLRRPNRWELARGLSPVAYLVTAAAILRRPAQFFRTLPAWSGDARARRFLLASAALGGVLADVGYLFVDMASHPNRQMSLDAVLSRANMQILLFLPFITFGSVLGLVLLTAAWAGLYRSRVHRRNLLAPVTKVCVYTSLLYVVWIPANLFVWGGLELLTRTAQINLLPERFRYGLGREEQITILIVVLNCLPPLLLYRYLGIGLRAIIYANR